MVRQLCRYVIQEIIKDMARNRSVEAKRKVKVLVLHEVDGLTKDAQHSLRRTMEKYSNSCRLVMLCNTVSKVCISRLCCSIKSISACMSALSVRHGHGVACFRFSTSRSLPYVATSLHTKLNVSETVKCGPGTPRRGPSPYIAKCSPCHAGSGAGAK